MSGYEGRLLLFIVIGDVMSAGLRKSLRYSY